MLSSRLFWKVFLAYAGLVLLAVSACVAIVFGWREEQRIEQVLRRLQVSATLLRSDVAARRVRVAAAKRTSTRLTFLSFRGPPRNLARPLGRPRT